MRSVGGRGAQKNSRRPFAAAAILLFVCGVLTAELVSATPAAAQSGRGDGGVSIAGRSLKCGRIPTRFDNNLPIEGAAVMGQSVILNPRLLNRHPGAVRLFVFAHECGHHIVGGSELSADCYAVGRGVKEGWLTADGLKAVCRSFNDAPETPTHPSGQRRCTNLDRCFATASAQQQKIASAAKNAAPRPVAPPVLISGPTLVGNRHSGGGKTSPLSTNAKTCAPLPDEIVSASDPIGSLIETDAQSSGDDNCS